MNACALTLVVALAAGCYSPEIASGQLQCSVSGSKCPSGFHCAIDGRCWKNGEDPSGGPDMGNILYPPAAVWTSCGGGSVDVGSSQLNSSVGGASTMGVSTTGASDVTFSFFGSQVR